MTDLSPARIVELLPRDVVQQVRRALLLGVDHTDIVQHMHVPIAVVEHMVAAGHRTHHKRDRRRRQRDRYRDVPSATLHAVRTRLRSGASREAVAAEFDLSCAVIADIARRANAAEQRRQRRAQHHGGA